MNASKKPEIEAFLEFWQQQPGSPEGKMAKAYNQALQDLNGKREALLSLIKPQKSSGRFIPVFAEGSEEQISDFEVAEHHLKDIQTDIEGYLGLSDGQPSMNSLADRLVRSRRFIAETSLDAKRTLERAIRNNEGLSLSDVETLPEIQAVMDKRDRAQRQFGPLIEDLQDRVSKIKKIREKYDKIEL